MLTDGYIFSCLYDELSLKVRVKSFSEMVKNENLPKLFAGKLSEKIRKIETMEAIRKTKTIRKKEKIRKRKQSIKRKHSVFVVFTHNGKTESFCLNGNFRKRESFQPIKNGKFPTH